MSSKKLVPFLTVDCETDPFLYGRVPEPFLWGIYDGATGEYWEFDHVNKVVAFLSDRDVIVYAHNGGKFDWHFLSHHLEANQPILIINGRLAKFKIGECEYRDSYSLLPVPLAQYQKTSFEYWKLEKPVRADHMSEIREYLKSDCVNLWNLVAGFEKEFGRHLTQAGAAMRIWQRKFKHTAPHSGPSYYDSFKPYYYGGRVQCFVPGDYHVKAHGVDIRSAYPSVMIDDHPISLGYERGSGYPSHIDAALWPTMFFDVRCVARGAFPYRGLNKMLYYPEDDVMRTYKVTGHELIAAMETGTVDDLEILRWCQFDGLISFRDYIEYFWNMRQEAKAAGDIGKVLYTKIFMNALYGKFGADPRNYKDYVLWHPNLLSTTVDKGLDFDFFREWLLVVEKDRERQEFYNVATAASITGAVRAKLWRAILKTKDPYYCDTDSITAGNVSALPMGDNLGEWSAEGTYNRIVVCGKKLYAFHKDGRPMNDDAKGLNWKKATKGARLTAQEVIEIAAGSRVEYKPEAPTFSAKRSEPQFISRFLKITAGDVRTVPREFDPEFIKDHGPNESHE